jgi:hypothetical protein
MVPKRFLPPHDTTFPQTQNSHIGHIVQTTTNSRIFLQTIPQRKEHNHFTLLLCPKPFAWVRGISSYQTYHTNAELIYQTETKRENQLKQAPNVKNVTNA